MSQDIINKYIAIRPYIPLETSKHMASLINHINSGSGDLADMYELESMLEQYNEWLEILESVARIPLGLGMPVRGNVQEEMTDYEKQRDYWDEEDEQETNHYEDDGLSGEEYY